MFLNQATNKMPHYPVLDGWRGISILCVLAAHMLPLGPKGWHLNGMVAPVGMSLFFTLSGFLITNSLIYRPEVRSFLIRRVFRILPLAWTYLVIALPLISASPATYLANFLFYANYPPFWLTELNSHFWSLCVEMQFYLFIALLFYILRQRGLLLLPAFCLLVTAVRIYEGAAISIVTHYRVDEILAGACLALTLKGQLGKTIPQILKRINPYWTLGLLLIASHPNTVNLAGYLRPYLAALLVGSTLYQEKSDLSKWLSLPILRYLAEISYALYVIHPLTYYAWLGTGDTIVKYSKRILSFVLTFTLAHTSTFYYEKRWIAWGKMLSKRKFS